MGWAGISASEIATGPWRWSCRWPGGDGAGHPALWRRAVGQRGASGAVTTHNACLAPDAAAGDPGRHDIATDLPSRQAGFAPASVVMDACWPILPSSASRWQTDAAASCSFRNVIIPPVAGGPRRCGHSASSLACITSYWLCGGCFSLCPILASAHRLDGRAHPLLPRQPLIAPNLGGGLGGWFARMLNCSFCRIKLLFPLSSCTVTVWPASQVRWLSPMRVRCERGP